jgi:hypothetical protein
MTKRRKISLAISAGALLVGAVLAHFKIGFGYALTGLTMVFHVIYAVVIPGTTSENWWKPAFLVTGLAYLTVWYLYALIIGYFMSKFGIMKTPKELQRAAAKARGDTGPAITGMGKLLKYGAAAAFIAVLVWMQGRQADQFMEKSKTAAIEHCGQDTSCAQNVGVHFDECYEANHDSYKSGKFNRKHVLNESGFNSCLTAYMPALAQTAAEEKLSATDTVDATETTAEAPAQTVAAVAH